MTTDKAALFDQTNIDELPWPDTLSARRVKETFTPIIKKGVRRYISNVGCPVGVLLVGRKVFPVVIETEGNHSYVGSLYGYYIVAACEEARKFANPFFRSVAQYFVSRFGKFFFAGILVRNVQVDNWLVTTNLHGEITPEDVSKIVNFFKSQHPDRAIIFRSLTAYADEELLRSLKQNGFSFIASRQIYLWDYRTAPKYSLKARHALRKDDALAKAAGYEWRDLDLGKQQEVLRILDLYRYLYLEKHSWNNPQYTEHFVEELCQAPNGFLRIKVLFKNDRIDGFVGYYVNQGILTAPFVGYDTGLPLKEGLYRMLMSQIRQEAREQNLILNGSAGAGEFKRTRGGRSITEFFAVYDRHLRWHCRARWFLLRLTMNTVGLNVLRSGVL